jgi:uncharacterized protein YbjT (DUF2867 family)
LNTGRTALVLGSTGLVGRHLLARLLDDARWSEVRSLTRRPTGIDHPKLAERLVDFERIEEYGHAFRVHDVFCCLGTTLRTAGSREAFERVDHDYVRQAAEISAIGRARHFLWISSLGANPHALAFYSRTKGRTEESIAALPLERWTAVRPSLLLGQRDEPRRGERVAAAVLRPLTPFFRGPLRPYRPIHADQVARGMIALSCDEPVPPELQYISGSEKPRER